MESNECNDENNENEQEEIQQVVEQASKVSTHTSGDVNKENAEPLPLKPIVNLKKNEDDHHENVECSKDNGFCTNQCAKQSSNRNNSLKNGLAASANGRKNTLNKNDHINIGIGEIPHGNPEEWNCDQVYSFVELIAGPKIASKFKAQEIDGLAFTLLKYDHLIHFMKLKIGPTLLIMHKFNEIRAKFK